MATTTNKGSDENYLPAWRLMANLWMPTSTYMLESVDQMPSNFQTWRDWLFPITAQDGTGNSHKQRRRIRTWSRNR